MNSGETTRGARATSPAILSVRDLTASRGGREIVRGVSLEAARGEIVALMGLSGGGKTTILRAIAGLDGIDRGEVSVEGRVGMVFQLHSLFEHLTAIENVMLAPMHVGGVSRLDAEARALELLTALGVAHRRDALPRELSGGEAQRVAIARSLAMDPPLLLLDEPTASLDPARRFELGQILKGLASGGRTLLFTTHDDDFARQFADSIVILADGVVVERGRPAEVLDNPQHPATRLLLQRVHEQIQE
jgi:ABC-type polar amino acid transport system ATPase subunit